MEATPRGRSSRRLSLSSISYSQSTKQMKQNYKTQTTTTTMDYYRILGLNKSATKTEIKDAFRKLAIKFHPDKHSASSKSVKDSATLKFKQVSEAYDVLSDDRKRADYNLRSGGGGGGYTTSSASSSYTNNYSSRTSHSGSGYNEGYGYGYGYSRPPYNNNGFALKFGKFAHYLTTRDFLLHATFVGYDLLPRPFYLFLFC